MIIYSRACALRKEAHWVAGFVCCIKTAKIRKSQHHLERMLIDREDDVGSYYSDIWSYCKGCSRRFIVLTQSIFNHTYWSELWRVFGQNDMTVTNLSVLQSFGSYLLCFGLTSQHSLSLTKDWLIMAQFWSN